MPGVRILLFRAAAAVLALGVLALLALWIMSEAVLRRSHEVKPERVTAAAAPSQAQEGRRLSKLYGCTSCHGAELRGHLFNDEPALVRNYAPNLTLLTRRYSDAQFAQVIRQGVRPADGRSLWGMPSATFHTMTDRELGAVLAFLRSIPPGGGPTPDEGTGLYARLAIVVNDLRPSEPPATAAVRSSVEQVAWARRHPPAELGPEHARGRHIAATVCAECHGSGFGGDATEGGPDLIVAGAYDREAFRRLLRTGMPPDGRDLGIMSEAAREDFVVFTDAEVDAIHGYLQARAAWAP